jgi:hypothetical protein
MDWQCTECGEPITFADGESISDATCRHSREAVHAWIGARRTLPTGAEQRWRTPSERADRSGRASASRPSFVGLSRGSAAGPGKGTLKKANRADRRAPSSIALCLVAGIAIALGIVAFPVNSAEEPDRNPSESSTDLYAEPDGSPSGSYTASITEPEESSTATPPPTPLGSSAPTYTPEPGNGLNTAGGRPRDTGGNDSYYDGNYDNDDEWHRDYGNPDEYYDGNYDNDDDYHRKYGRD